MGARDEGKMVCWRAFLPAVAWEGMSGCLASPNLFSQGVVRHVVVRGSTGPHPVFPKGRDTSSRAFSAIRRLRSKSSSAH